MEITNTDEVLERIEAAAGLAKLSGNNIARVRQMIRWNGAGLALGIVGVAVVWAMLGAQLLGVETHVRMTALVIGVAFAGLAIVSLLGLGGLVGENLAAQEFVTRQLRISLDEVNAEALTRAAALSAVRAVTQWRSPAAYELIEVVVRYAVDRAQGESQDRLHAEYEAIRELMPEAAPDAAQAEQVLRMLRPQDSGWETNVAGVPARAA